MNTPNANQPADEPQWYQVMHLDPLPRKHPKGFVLAGLTGYCKLCNTQLEPHARFITEHASCLDVCQAGLCIPCKLISTTRMRYYGNYATFAGPKGWTTITMRNPKLIPRLLNWCLTKLIRK
jgi:hypothetical protein